MAGVTEEEEAANMEVEGEVQATTEAAKGIRAIDKTTVHRICSGQVVLTLSTAVKELVENSLDAGATSIDVRLQEHGATLLEVVDNGNGVEEHDFEGLTLKHHTSKIQDFGDLVGVKTFGFRGEALSSLCALSDLTITTRHATSDVATRLTYNHNGTLTSKTATSRLVGTTVTLQGLFSTLPVRHKEFQRNIKREFNKMVQVLYSYCLISTGVRISCTNQNEKGKKTVVVSTSGHPTIRENLSSIFGAKQAASLLEFQQEPASQDVLEEFGVTKAASTGEPKFTLEGLVSTCSHGQGRSSTDRQFYFINARPCDPAKVTKLVNEVYHQYNRHQFPCVVLNIRLQEGDVDINVTPDKRQILVSREKLLLATIKTSLMQLYEHIPSTYSMQNTSFTPSQKALASPSPSPIPSAASSPCSPSPTASKFSALTQRFGRRSSGAPQPSTPPGTLSGMKRSLSLGGLLTPSPENKQPKLMNFLKPSPAGTSTRNENSSTQSTYQCIEGVHPLASPIAEGTSQEDADMATEAGSRQEGGESSCGKALEAVEISEKVEAEGDAEQLNACDLGQNAASDMHGDLGSDNDRSTYLNPYDNRNIDLIPRESRNSDLDFGNGDISTLICNGTPDKPESSVSNGVLNGMLNGGCYNSLPSQGLGAKNGSSLKATPHRSILPVSSNCRKIHSSTTDFLNNLKAKKCLITSNRASGGRKNSTEQCGVDANPSTLQTVQDDEVDVVFEGVTDKSTVRVKGCEGGASNGSDEDARTEANRKVLICEEYNTQRLGEQRKCKHVAFDMESVKKKLRVLQKKGEQKHIVRRFRAKISPTDNTAAEDELRKEISKDMFTEMEILGQFNLGFIITRLDQDLFIIDQHATDEEYNFETLQQTCILQNQRLIAPQTLELTAIGEATLLDNLEIFCKNGYEFLVKEDQPAGRRVSLVSMPVSRGWEFGRSDVEELIFMLSDAPGTMCRPSRVRAMFASRACRKSVMIGTALTHQQMRQLVTHMGEIEQPWNCPHGRPTMRHLINLDMVVPLQSQDGCLLSS